MPQVSDYQVFREKVRFGIDFGRVLGRVLGGFWSLWTSKKRKKAFKRGSKLKLKKYEKRKANERENSVKRAGSAAWRWAPGREDLGPELALMSLARHSTLPLEGGGGSLSAKRSAASSTADFGGWRAVKIDGFGAS